MADTEKIPYTTRWLGLGLLAALALAFLALDDITTDNATEFTLEFGLLAFCGLCIAAGIWRLAAHARFLTALACSLLLLTNALAVWRLATEGRPADPASGYLLLRISFLLLLLFTIWMIIDPLRRRSNPRRAAS